MMYDSYIMQMQRTQISLSDEDRRVLSAVARRTGQSMSALIRDAIHATYGRVTDDDGVRGAILGTFDVIDVGDPGEQLVDQLRSGVRLNEHA